MSKLSDLNELKTKIIEGISEDAIKAQHSKGKLTARERINRLFDDGSFIELGLFAKNRKDAFNIKDNSIPYDGVITGYGQINGRLVFVASQDYTVLDGSLGEIHAEKIAKCQENALKVGAPIIYIYDTGGARIQEGIDSLAGYAKIFYNSIECSGVIPQISIIMGSCNGSAVYGPAIGDFVFMVDGISQMFVTGPQVIRAVTGEDISAEDLGGAKTHSSISGVSHFVLSSDEEGINKVKELLTYLPQNNYEKSEKFICSDDLNRVCYELNDIIPENSLKPYEMKDIIKTIADNNIFFETQFDFAKNIITGFIHLGGKSIGIIANEPKVLSGCLDINASDKAARFIRTCDSFNIPLLTLVDVNGFVPGIKEEHGGIIRHSAKMIFAYGEATIPMVTIIIRKAYGGASISMCPKQLGADIVYAWPSAEISVMSAEAAVSVLYANEIKNSTEPQKEKLKRIEEYEEKMINPYVAASCNYIDDIIEPANTRKMLIAAFDTMETKVIHKAKKKHGNIPL